MGEFDDDFTGDLLEDCFGELDETFEAEIVLLLGVFFGEWMGVWSLSPSITLMLNFLDDLFGDLVADLIGVLTGDFKGDLTVVVFNNMLSSELIESVEIYDW